MVSDMTCPHSGRKCNSVLAGLRAFQYSLLPSCLELPGAFFSGSKYGSDCSEGFHILSVIHEALDAFATPKQDRPVVDEKDLLVLLQRWFYYNVN